MSKEEQKPNIYQIPKNSFDTGYVLNGQFKTRNFVEGIILALPFLGIFIYGWHDLGWDVQSTVAYCAILCAAAFLGAAHGVGGDSLFEFIQRVIRFRQSRRISKYNPRIKTELEPEYLIHDGRMLPKDKLKQMLGTVKGKVLGEENGPISSDITDEELIEDVKKVSASLNKNSIRFRLPSSIYLNRLIEAFSIIDDID